MFAAILATLLFSFCAIATNRSCAQLGNDEANVTRLALAVAVLGVWAFTFGQGFGGPALFWFVLSGIIGFGLGDIGVFNAVPRIGARLMLLFTQCMAAPVAVLAEWLWLGNTMTPVQLGWVAVILVGTAFALAPDHNPNRPQRPRRVFVIGCLFGLLAAAGQGIGAVVSRAGYDLLNESGLSIDGATAAFQRVTGGFVIALLYLGLVLLWRRWRNGRIGNSHERPPHADASVSSKALWVVLNAMTGPILGVACFQWALESNQSGLVLAIVATTPVVVMPLAFWMDGEVPRRRSILGGVIAVAGVIALLQVT